MALALVVCSATLAAEAPSTAQPVSKADGVRFKERLAIYRRKLALYKKAHDPYEALAAPYWSAVTAKRAQRRAKRAPGRAIALDDYVLTQPPVYVGPPEPEHPDAQKRAAKAVPVVDDFLKFAKQEFGFVPDRPASEIAYKRAYAKAAAKAGLTKRECVRIYGFESGGDGAYDVQAGRESNPKARAISTALGYNQLLNTNSVELLAEAGEKFISALEAKAAAAKGSDRAALLAKIATLKKMIAFSHSVPDKWDAHVELAKTDKGLGVHALNLDIDVGPLLQTEKLLTSVTFARRSGYTKPLTAAELEMMNLTGDGNGFDMVLMPAAMRAKVPTSNFFQRGGYERNPVAARNNTVAKLIAATDTQMEEEAKLQGAKDMAAIFDDR